MRENCREKPLFRFPLHGDDFTEPRAELSLDCVCVGDSAEVMDRPTHLEFPSSSREKERESIPMNEDCLNLAICCILYVQRQTYSNFSFTDLISPKLYERSLYWIGCAWVEWER